MGSTACSHVTIIPATTFAQPSFKHVAPINAPNFKTNFILTSADMSLATLANANNLIGAVSGAYFAGGMIGAIATSEATDPLGLAIEYLFVLLACIHWWWHASRLGTWPCSSLLD
jgi:hypothetical protein